MRSREAWDRLYEKDDGPWKGNSDQELPLHGAVLELGIGNGKNLASLPGDASVIGIDHSRPALLSCRRSHDLPLVQADVTALPFADGSMTGVAASHVLGHLNKAERQRAAVEIERVLEEGGLLYVSVFGEGDMRFGRGREIEERTFERGNGIFCHYFLEDEVISLFPRFREVRAWERRLEKRYHGRREVRQERRSLLAK